MSGKPNYTEVKGLTFHLTKMAQAESRIASSTRALEHTTDELNKAREEYADAKRAVFTLMENMDVRSGGNTGYEERMSAFLVMLREEIEKNAPVRYEVGKP